MFLRYVSESRMKNDGLSQISKMKAMLFILIRSRFADI
jgi:hypothetical protein